MLNSKEDGGITEAKSWLIPHVTDEENVARKGQDYTQSHLNQIQQSYR